MQDKESSPEVSTPEFYPTPFDQTANQFSYDPYTLMPTTYEDHTGYARSHLYSSQLHDPALAAENHHVEYNLNLDMVSGAKMYQPQWASIANDYDTPSPSLTSASPGAITPPAMNMEWEGDPELKGKYDQLKQLSETSGDVKINDEYLKPFLKRVPLDPKVTGRGSRNGAKHFVCRWSNCDKTIHRADHARDHIRSHLDNKPYKCPVLECDSRFIREHDQKRHIKSQHKPARGIQHRRVAAAGVNGDDNSGVASTSNLTPREFIYKKGN